MMFVSAKSLLNDNMVVVNECAGISPPIHPMQSPSVLYFLISSPSVFFLSSAHANTNTHTHTHKQKENRGTEQEEATEQGRATPPLSFLSILFY